MYHTRVPIAIRTCNVLCICDNFSYWYNTDVSDVYIYCSTLTISRDM